MLSICTAGFLWRKVLMDLQDTSTSGPMRHR